MASRLPLERFTQLSTEDVRLQVEAFEPSSFVKLSKIVSRERIRYYTARKHPGASQGNANATQPKTYHLQTTLQTWVMRQAKAEWRTLASSEQSL